MPRYITIFQVYGLNFSSKDDADVFATAMLRALEVRNCKKKSKEIKHLTNDKRKH